jgi:mannose-1-phosphate guanylyltransferase
MRILVLSGGSGRRLWPLSNDIRSKQFLKVLVDGEGHPQSMIQRVYGQLRTAGLSKHVSIVAGESQRDQIVSQIGEEVELILEPARRDTFPAILLGCAYLESIKGVPDDEPVLVIPVDPYVEDRYFQDLIKVAEAVASLDELVLLGAEPTEPTEQYGYILRESTQGEPNRVISFVEKPAQERAEALIAEGALWNLGVFGFTLGYLKRIVGRDSLDYDSLRRAYDSLEKTSFDYKIVEGARNIWVYPYSGEWKDLGSWKTLTEVMPPGAYGRVITDDNHHSNQIINELLNPLVVFGVRNSVVIATHEGILVADKMSTEQLKDRLKGLESRPMFEEKRWGRYSVLNEEILKDDRLCITKKLTIEKDKGISYQYHHHRDEIWTVVAGRGLLVLDGVESIVTSGDIVKIPALMKHSVVALETMSLIEVQIGTRIFEGDIVRLDQE